MSITTSDLVDLSDKKNSALASCRCRGVRVISRVPAGWWRRIFAAMPCLLLEMGTIRLIYYTTKLPIFQDFRVIISLPEWIFLVNNRFKSCLLNTFVLSLQSKETQKVHQRFRAVSAAECKKRAPWQPIDYSEARFHYNLPVFRPKCKKKPLLPW